MNSGLRQKRQKKMTLALVAVTGLIVATPLSHADVASDMESFYANLGGSASYSAAAAFQGQSAGYVTLGGFNARTPIRTISPISIQLPSPRAGCGGIDAYLGGFSYINKDQLVSMIKSIGSSSVGYALKLAIATISPTIDAKLSEFQSYVQTINDFNINSCEAAQKLVNASVSGAKNAFCWTSAQHSGKAVDFADARQKCSDQSFQKNIINDSFLGSLKGPDGEVAGGGTQSMPFAGNVVWDGLMKDNSLKNDPAFAELLMSMTGTVIYPLSTGAGTGDQPDVRPSIVDYSTILAAAPKTPIKVYRCSNHDRCLSISEVDSYDLGIFRQKISASINSLVSKIATDNGKDSSGALTSSEIAVLTHSKLPVVQLIQTVSDIDPALASSVVSDYTGLIVADLAYQYVKSTADIAERAITQSHAEQATKDLLISRIRSSVIRAQQEKNTFIYEVGGLDAIINRITLYQRKLASSMSPTMQQRLAFGRMLDYR